MCGAGVRVEAESAPLAQGRTGDRWGREQTTIGGQEGGAGGLPREALGGTGSVPLWCHSVGREAKRRDRVWRPLCEEVQETRGLTHFCDACRSI
ncbi:hypothetical protein E2C01_018673 [Portunus trituberculatus]|uniref:Uncharacterized protein n=1 Tax=Portunus trituberculatus TaxID=210409 RepID=A0A5B7DWA3_PORTR|nr:hypothetical protein [Portunus trituberculatus]